MTRARTPSPGRPSPRRPRRPAGPRRWPELVAATLVLALGVGLGSLLLGERRAPAEPVAAAPQPTTSIPVSPGAVVADGSPQTAAPAQAQTTAGKIPPAPAAPPAPKIPPPVLPEPRRMPAPPTPPRPVEETTTAASPITQPPVTQAPATQTPTPQTPAAQAPATQPPATPAPEPAAPAEPAPATTPEPATPTEPAAPAPGTPAVAPSAQRTPLRSDYRVMLGTFGSEAALRSATAGVSALGYTVYAMDLGNQFVAQVGPFADEASGQQAAADIRRAYARAELYPPRGQTLRNPAPAAAAEAPATPEPASEPAPTPAETPTAAPAPAGPVYVQVGAFNNVEGAQRFVEQLRAQGFSPSVNAPETGKVTVLLGPLTGSDLTSTEGRLDAAGLDHFRLR